MIQVQIQALLAGGVGGGEKAAREVGRGGAEVATPQLFDGTAVRVAGFIMAM